MVSRLFTRIVTAIDHRFGWHRLPVPFALISLIGIRNRLRHQNLYDTGPPQQISTAEPEVPDRFRTARTADGTEQDIGADLVKGDRYQALGRPLAAHDGSAIAVEGLRANSDGADLQVGIRCHPRPSARMRAWSSRAALSTSKRPSWRPFHPGDLRYRCCSVARTPCAWRRH